MAPPRGRQRGVCEATAGLGARMQGQGQAMAVGLRLLLRLLFLPLLIVYRGDILEGDGALDLLACEDGLLVPVDKDADVARDLGRRHDQGSGPSARFSGAEAALREVVVHLQRWVTKATMGRRRCE